MTHALQFCNLLEALACASGTGSGVKVFVFCLIPTGSHFDRIFDPLIACRGIRYLLEH